MPTTVVRRLLEGRYKQACKSSNSNGGQKKAEYFDSLFRSYTGSTSATDTSSYAWGIDVSGWSLTVQHSDTVSSSENSTANSCSYVRLYNHNGTKALFCGDMESEGMSALLRLNPAMRTAVNGVNILVAPHHGHSSGYSTLKANHWCRRCIPGDCGP
jgi:beta-lactamase superfamily II metal-dependent hydrolase